MNVTGNSTDVTTYVVLRLTATGLEATGITIADIDLQYVRSGEVPAAKVDAVALAATNTAHTDNRAIEVDLTDQPGLYRVDWPDAAFAAGVKEVILSVKVATAFTEHLRVTIDAPVNLTSINGDLQSAIDLKDFADAGYDSTTNKVEGVKLVDLLTAYTNNTPQSGDAYGRIGSGGGGLIALGDTRIANLDAAVTTRATPAQVNTECDTALADYDGPTNTEMVLRTLAAADYATAATLATVAGVTDKLDTALELDGAVYRYTVNALELAPTGGSAPTAAEITTAIFTALLASSDFSTSASFGKLVKDNLDAAVSTRATPAQVNTEADTALADAGVTTTVTGRIDAAISTRATPAQVNTECDTALADYDGPTSAEMNARTLVTASYATAAGLTALMNFVDTEVDAILIIANKLDTAMELDGAEWRFTAAALAEAPTGGSAPTAIEIRQEIDSNSTQLAAIAAKTGNLPADPAGLAGLASAHGAGSWATATGFAVAGDAMGLTVGTGNALVAALSAQVTTDHGSGSYLTATSVAVSDKTGFKLAADGVDAIVVETGLNLRQSQSIIASAVGGVLAGAATTNVLIAAAGAPATNRINATVDSSGNRTAVALAPPA